MCLFLWITNPYVHLQTGSLEHGPVWGQWKFTGTRTAVWGAQARADLAPAPSCATCPAPPSGSSRWIPVSHIYNQTVTILLALCPMSLRSISSSPKAMLLDSISLAGPQGTRRGWVLSGLALRHRQKDHLPGPSGCKALPRKLCSLQYLALFEILLKPLHSGLHFVIPLWLARDLVKEKLDVRCSETGKRQTHLSRRKDKREAQRRSKSRVNSEGGREELFWFV